MNKFWVIDTNVIVSALLHPNGKERAAFTIARQQGTLVISPSLKEEYFRVLSRKKFDKYISLETRLELFSAILEEALELHPTKTVSVCRDPKDNMLLELAIEAQVDAIITGDEDLLVLNPFQDIPILNAKSFSESFDSINK
jgi:putative PIN family toxin of toxin-antitoxin system